MPHNALNYTFSGFIHVRHTIYRLRFYNPFWSVLHNQLKGLTAKYNGRIMVIYVNVGNCWLGFCLGRAAVAGYYPCKLLFDALRLFIACMCILSTATAKLILGTFTGFIMASSYYIVFRLIAL